MIHTVIIKNFKSLENVTFRLGKFNCLVGMNGAGKSTVLQALDLLAQLMHGNVDQVGVRCTCGWQAGRFGGQCSRYREVG